MAKSENKMNTIISELQNASKMHLRQSRELADHVEDMESGPLKKLSCWKGYKAKGKKKSPSGKRTKSGKIKMVNNCVKK